MIHLPCGIHRKSNFGIVKQFLHSREYTCITHILFICIYIYISKKLGKLFCREWRNFFTSLVVVFFSESWNNSVFEFEKSVTSFKLEYTQHLVAGMIFFSFEKHIDSIYEPSSSKNFTIIVQRIFTKDLKDADENYFILLLLFILF